MYPLLIRRDQVNVLVYRPDRPYFKQKKKNNITKFWPFGFFFYFIFCFLKKKKKKRKKRNKTKQTYINNQNQEAFIVIIINYKLRVFFSVFAMQNVIFKKVATRRIK